MSKLFKSMKLKLAGPREQLLLVFGIAWILLGIATLDEAGYPGVDSVPHFTIPYVVRMFLWCGSGVVAIATAFRPCGKSDALGWAVLYFMPAVRALSYGLAYIWNVTPLPGDGYPDGVIWCGVYGIIVVTVHICSGWPNPADVGRARRRRADRIKFYKENTHG